MISEVLFGELDKADESGSPRESESNADRFEEAVLLSELTPS